MQWPPVDRRLVLASFVAVAATSPCRRTDTVTVFTRSKHHF
jgi:hypothetical protein